MQLQTFAKIGICSGIAAIVIFSVLFGLMMVSQLQNEFGTLFLDHDKKLDEMKNMDSFILLNEKYPDAYTIENKNRHRVGLETFAYNFQTGNLLKLNLQYEPWEDRIREHVRCDVRDHHLRQELSFGSAHTASFVTEDLVPYPRIFLSEGNAEGAFASDFIKYTNCLEMGNEDEPIKKVSFPEYGEIPTITISIPEGSDIPGCENIAQCFSPEEITIKKGDIIEWKNYDDSAHTVSSGDPQDGPTSIFDSEILLSDQTFAIKFEAAGEYPYFCMVHPWQEGMITVIK
jgi:plastocyanin